MTRIALFALSAAVLLGGCSTHGQLRKEIAEIQGRVQVMEDELAGTTAGIGGTTQSVRSAVSYRPLVAWGEAFSARPAAERTIAFRQTASGGDIHKVSHRCRWNFQRAGERAWIHEQGSTRIDALIERLVVEPTDTGLLVRAPMKVDGRTQVAGNYRPPCQGGSAGANVGVTGEARPETVLRLSFAELPGNRVGYRFALVSPERIGLEMRAHLGYFRIGWTMPLENLAMDLAQGEFDLMFEHQGAIRMPDGTLVPYRLKTGQPRIETGISGISYVTDVDVAIGQGDP